jgi:putative endonuclease
MARAQTLGGGGEDLAAAYLGLIGWPLEARRVRLGGVEVDLLVRDGATRVLVEVKLRSRSDFGGAPLALGREQCERLRRAAAALERREPGPVRVDLVAVDLSDDEATIRHYRNAVPGR